MVRSLGAPVNSSDKREPTEAEACIPKMISTTPTTSKAIPTTLCMPLSSCTLLQGFTKKLADVSGWYRRRFPLCLCARSLLHLPCRTLLRAALPAVMEPRRSHRSVSQPLLHTRQTQPQRPARASSSPSAHPGTGLNYAQADSRVVPGTRANGPGAAGRLHFVKQIGQHELQALLRGARVEEPRGGRHAAQQGIAVLRRKAKPADLMPCADPQRRHRHHRLIQ